MTATTPKPTPPDWEKLAQKGDRDKTIKQWIDDQLEAFRERIFETSATPSQPSLNPVLVDAKDAIDRFLNSIDIDIFIYYSLDFLERNNI